MPRPARRQTRATRRSWAASGARVSRCRWATCSTDRSSGQTLTRAQARNRHRLRGQHALAHLRDALADATHAGGWTREQSERRGERSRVGWLSRRARSMEGEEFCRHGRTTDPRAAQLGSGSRRALAVRLHGWLGRKRLASAGLHAENGALSTDSLALVILISLVQLS